jgi:OmcA/MtrC family decaheme c-type cytochrome
MASLNLVLAGPTTDYPSFRSESARGAQGSGGTYTYTFQNPLPDEASGTYTVGIEGYRSVTLLPGTTVQQTVRDVGVNKTINFSVDGSPVQPRRAVVSTENCNQCHFALAAHGDIRNRVEQCVLCHNPNQTDQARRPADQMPPQTVDFRAMIHKIHTGEELENEYTVYGFGGTAHDFTEVLFPGDRRNCAECHINNSQQLPLPLGLLPVRNPRGFLDPMGPATAACLSCHDTRAAAAHADINTSPALGESCAVCLGQKWEFSVGRVHAR